MFQSSDDDLPALCTRILQTQGSDLSVEQRRKAVRRLLASLETKERSKHYPGEEGELYSPCYSLQWILTIRFTALFVAVSALKTLGRTPAGTEDLAAEEARVPYIS